MDLTQIKDIDPLLGPKWAVMSCVSFLITRRLVEWCLLPEYLKDNEAQKWRWCNTYTSLIHSFISGVWVLLCFYETPELADDLINGYSTKTHAVVSFSTGYFMYDFVDIVTAVLNRNAFELMVHHTFVISSFMVAIVGGQFTVFAAISLFVEVNSIFLHLRQMLQIQRTDKGSYLYRYNCLANIGTFLIFRIVTLTWLTRWIVVNRAILPIIPYVVGGTGCTAIFIMNIALFVRILQNDFLSASEQRSGSRQRELTTTSSANGTAVAEKRVTRRSGLHNGAESRI